MGGWTGPLGNSAAIPYNCEAPVSVQPVRGRFLPQHLFDVWAVIRFRATFATGAACVLTSLLSACSRGGDSDGGSLAVARETEANENSLTNLGQLTFTGQNAEAYFSSDGTRLIFQRTGDAESCDQQYTINVDGSGMQRVSNGLGRTTCGYYYQRDERILYSSTFQAGEACPTPPDFSQGYVWPLSDFDVYTALPNGDDLQRLTTEPGYDAEATLSPNGETIVFTSMRDGDLDIYSMNVDGSNVQRLTNRLGYDGGPFFSSDGSKIVYRAWYPTTSAEEADYTRLLSQKLVRPRQMEIWVMNADGSGERQVTHLGGANFAPFFHPDGNRIIFASNHHVIEADPRSRNFDLLLVDLDGQHLRQITYSDAFDGFPMFSPDGTKLAFASNRYASVEGETNIFVADWVED